MGNATNRGGLGADLRKISTIFGRRLGTSSQRLGATRMENIPAREVEMGIFDRLFRKQKAARNLDEEIAQAQANLAQAQQEYEKTLHSLKPSSEHEKFVPSFLAWWGLSRNQELNLDEALDRYIREYDLLQPTKPDEPVSLSRTAAKLKVLEDPRVQLNPDAQADLEKYIFALQGSLIAQHMKWESDQKRDALKKRKELDH